MDLPLRNAYDSFISRWRLVFRRYFFGFNISDWLCVGYVVFGATFLSYLLIPMALRVMRPTTVSMYNYIQPVVSSAVAIAFFGDELTMQKLFSAAMIFLGVYLVTISRRAADSV